MRDFIMDLVKEGPLATLPAWVQQLVDLGLAYIDRTAPALGFTSFQFSRDTVLLSLPVAAGLPDVFAYFAAAGIVAAALVAAGSAVVDARQRAGRGRDQRPRLRAAAARDPADRLPASPWAASPCWAPPSSLLAPTDPLRLLLWCLALSGSTLFPVLVLSVWWKRMNAFGALAGLACGFGVGLLAILAGEANVIGLDGALAGVLGIPAGTAAALLASIATPSPSRSMLELVRELRIPGGEVIYDREMRILRLKNRERS